MKHHVLCFPLLLFSLKYESKFQEFANTQWPSNIADKNAKASYDSSALSKQE